jgi:hypothetical protein
MAIGTGENTSQASYEFQYSSGSQAWYLPTLGYEGAATMQYLSLDAKYLEHDDTWLWSALLGSALSVDSRAWGFRVLFNNNCEFCQTEKPQFVANAGYGIGYNYKKFESFIYPQVDSRTWVDSTSHSRLGIGYRLGARWAYQKYSISGEHEKSVFHNLKIEAQYISGLYSLSVNKHLRLRLQEKDTLFQYIENF